MSILEVIEKQGCRKGAINALFQRTYTRLYEVNTSGPRVGTYAVRTAAGIPQVGTQYKVFDVDGTTVLEFDNGSFVNAITPQEVDGNNGTAWEVTVDYGPYNPATNPQDPTQALPKVSFSSQRFDRPVFQDLSGNPIVNSAGDGFSEPPTVDDCRSIMTVVRNERIKAVAADPLAIPPIAASPGFDYTLAKRMQNTLNNAIWNGAAIGTVKCGAITTSEPQQAPDGWWYLAVTYPFEEHLDGWKKVLLDQGYAQLDGSTPPVAKQIQGKDGQPVNEPVPLDGSGHRLAFGSAPTYKAFDVYNEVDFSIFNIDLSSILGLT